MLAELRGRVAALLVALCALAPAAPALDVDDLRVGDVYVQTSYFGPGTLDQGYFPVRVELWNQGAEAVDVDLDGEQSWQQEDFVHKSTHLEAGERASFELVLRARVGRPNAYELTFATGDAEGVIQVDVDYGWGAASAILYAAADPLPAGTVERWASEWQSDTSGTVGGREFKFSGCTFDQLSETWIAYTSLESVVLDASSGAPSPAVLDALLAWVRAGGRLVVCGADPAALFAARPEDAKWLRPAWRITDGETWGRQEAYRVGFGRVVLVDTPRLGAVAMDEAADLVPALHDALVDQGPSSWYGREWVGTQDRTRQVERELPGFGDLPLRGLMLLLVLFAVLMGPVNFLWVKRRGKPVLLLVTVPLLSLGTGLALVLFGVFAQGLDVKVSTRSFAILDQLGQRVTCAEVRRLFAGSSPGEGLRPAQGTAVMPVVSGRYGGPISMHRFLLDLDRGRLLGGDYLPVRTPTTQLLLSDHASRLRLEVTAVGDEVEVSNALGGRVEELVLRDARGALHHLGTPLDPGASARLRGGVEDEQEPLLDHDLKRLWGEDAPAKLAPGTWLAVVDAPDLRDACGVPVTVVEGRHLVLGVYALPVEESR
ncbi:MAG: hypothetical protein H6828_06225 [Planctomycetes bacterium]|nr:hypothetical protein [Planctomycetota bacterium]